MPGEFISSGFLLFDVPLELRMSAAGSRAIGRSRINTRCREADEQTGVCETIWTSPEPSAFREVVLGSLISCIDRARLCRTLIWGAQAAGLLGTAVNRRGRFPAHLSDITRPVTWLWKMDLPCASNFTLTLLLRATSRAPTSSFAKWRKRAIQSLGRCQMQSTPRGQGDRR
jgi:hypothetical protein